MDLSGSKTLFKMNGARANDGVADDVNAWPEAFRVRGERLTCDGNISSLSRIMK